MTTPYATSEQYETWSGQPAPANADWLLARATELIDAIVTAPFDIDDETELPTDAKVATTLRNATCAQVLFWDEVGFQHDIDGLAGSAFSVGGLSGKRAPREAPQAVRILKGEALA